MADNDIMKDCGCECGCTLEIGTVINNDDTVYECELKGDASSVEETVTYYKEEAKKADSSATVSVTDVSVGDIVVKNVKIQFSCAAEKIIFQMRTKAV